MQLPSPVIVQPPTIIRRTGEVRVQKPITVSELDITLIDNAKRKYCAAHVGPCPHLLALWTGAAYDEAGDYTQDEAEERILELLGSDIKAGLEGLFVPPKR